MKYIYIIGLFLLLLSNSTFGQQVIMAKDAYRHIGERITVKDSAYFVKVYNDSTTVAELGNRRLIAPLTVIFSAGKNPDFSGPGFSNSKYITYYLQKGRLSVNGFLLLIKGHPTIIVSDWHDLKVD